MFVFHRDTRMSVHKSLLTTLCTDRQFLHCIAEIAESPVLLFPVFKSKASDTVVTGCQRQPYVHLTN